MKLSQRIQFFLPFIILFALFGLMWRELFYSTPNELPSALIGEVVPDFHLENLMAPHTFFTPAMLHGQVSLVNVWATWCYACRVEAPMLMKIKTQYHLPIYGIAYKDDRDEIKKWLEDKGNPYVLIGDDKSGDVAIDLGVYGTPETFIISPQGKIIYRHIGAIDQKNWNEVLYPLIRKYQS